MTARIYYTDPYCRRFEAVVTRALEHNGRPAVVLDRTAFYPSSGGQPFDTGVLGVATVVDVVDGADDVVHVLSAEVAEGTIVRGEIDWHRRFDHMQQHTGQHVLSAAFDRLFENRTVSFHMGADVATIDLAREVSRDQTARAEDDANRVVWEDRDVSIRFVDPSRPDPAAEPLPLRKEASRAGVLRLIEVEGFDLSACGGTHVARTGAIGMIAIAGVERFKGGTRVTFACGARALRVLRTLRESVAGSVKILSVLPDHLPAAIERMQTDARDLRRTIRRFQEAAAAHEAARLARSAEPVGEVRIVIEALDGWDAAGLKAIASGITTVTRAAVVLLSTTSPREVVVARSADVPLQAHDVLRVLTDRFGGRGGGKADLAQGGGLAGEMDVIVRVARGLISNPS